MSSIKNILLHLDGSPGMRARVRAAAALAERLDATVAATYAATPSYYPAVVAEGAAYAALLQEYTENCARRAREDFEALGAGPRVNWRELPPGPVIPGFVDAALTADLLVLGQHDPTPPGPSPTPADFVETVIIGSGRPAVVVPYASDRTPIGRTALVAWKPTREAARALSAALPLLKLASRVHVAGFDANLRPVEHLLLRHGIEATFHHEPAAGANTGEFLLSRAADLDADLLVMGCYGHSRVRELVLGGVTRTVLSSMTLPVLMAH